MEITVKDLIERLSQEKQDLPLFFGGLDFMRIKDRGTHIQIEFSQSVYLNEFGNVVVQNHSDNSQQT